MAADILITRLDPDVPLPSYAHPGDAGADLVTTVDVHLEPGERALVPTGIAMALPDGYVGLVHPRSGLAARFGVSIVNAPGHRRRGLPRRGQVLLVNLDRHVAVDLSRGDRIAQLVVQRVEHARFVEVERLPGSARGAGGYGSTGRFPHRRRPPTRSRGDALMFRRRKAEVEPTDEVDDDRRRAAVEPTDPRARGPWDASEVTVDEDDGPASTWAGCCSPRTPSSSVQLQVDEASGQVVAVMLAGEDGAAELRAFAAPRNGDIWERRRRKAVAAEVAQMGGTATEREGTWGTELVVSLMVDLPDGQRAQQESVVIGITGPRWLLRATLFGRPAAAWDPDGNVETALRDIVVVRGSDPMPPGDALPLTMPPEARRTDPQPD